MGYNKNNSLFSVIRAQKMYIIKVALNFQSAQPVQGRHIHRYETRVRDIHYIQLHRTTAFDRLPSESGVKLIKKLPEDLKLLLIFTQKASKRLMLSKELCRRLK